MKPVVVVTKKTKLALSVAAVLALCLTAILVPYTLAQQGQQWQTSDNITWLDLNGTADGCSLFLTTGAYAALPANAGAQSAPGLVRVQNQEVILEDVTTAAASAATLDCDLIPPVVRTTPSKGVQITGVIVYYGTQTSALTSISSPNTLSTLTLPTSIGAAAAGTVAAATQTATFSPVLASAQLATTTSGQCYAQQVTFSAPIIINNPYTRVVFEEVFNQTAATATVYQVCGVAVTYNNVVF